VELRPEDMPGRPLSRIACDDCGEHVQDGREVHRDGEILCKACAGADITRRSGRVRLWSVMQKKHNGLDIRSKIWLETDGEPVFGRGRRFLLEAIDIHGSINSAAREVGISYRKAWATSQPWRSGWNIAGCASGRRQERRRAALTQEAREFLRKFEALEEG